MASKPAQKEKGAALLETAICMPILALLCVSIYDVGNYCIETMALAQAAREGVRLAAVTPDYQMNTNYYDGTTYSGAPTFSDHQQMLAKTYQALNALSPQLPNTSQLLITSSGDPTANKNFVTVQISGTYVGLMEPFQSIPIEATFSGPYMNGG